MTPTKFLRQLHPELKAILNRVIKHLAKQKAVSVSGGGCRYRDDHGHKCAIGALIPDELYSPDIEQMPILSFTGINNQTYKEIVASLQALAPSIHLEDLMFFLQHLQKFHDQPSGYHNALVYGPAKGLTARIRKHIVGRLVNDITYAYSWVTQ